MLGSEPQPRIQAQPVRARPAGDGRTPRRAGLRRGEAIAGLSALALLGLMFGAEWFGIAEGAGSATGSSGAENAWHGLTLLRWLMLATIAAAVGSVLLHLSQRSHGSQTDTSRVVTGLGMLTAVLLVYRVLIDLPAPDKIVDQKLGAVLGVLSAFGIAIGGYEAMREQRRLDRVVAHRRRREEGVGPRRPEVAPP